MNKYKKTKYMMSIPLGNEYILFHTLYGYLDAIPIDLYKKLEKEKIKEIDQENLNALKNHNFIILDSVDEDKIISKYLNIYERNRNHEKNYYISFSYDCNFDCVYCFEKDKDGDRLSQENLFNILDVINKERDKKDCKIILYGGEPLLLQNYSMIKTVLKFSISKNIKVKIITNGYNLNLFLNLFVEYRNILDSILVTLDGEREQHNQSRVLKNKNGTYDEIIKNIRLANNNNLPIEIRVNIGTDNCDEIKKFLKNYEMCRFKVHIHFIEDNRNLNDGKYVVLNRNDVIIDLYNFCSSHDNFLLEYAPLQQLDSMINEQDTILPLFDYCNSDNIVLFDGSSNMYNCTESCGNVDYLIKPEKHNYFVNDERCKDCRFGPICGGGCMQQRKKNKSSCKDDIKQLIELFIMNKLEVLGYDI